MFTKEQLTSFYVRQMKSMQEIADTSGCSVHKVQYWMDRHRIPRRSLSEAIYTKLNPDGDPFHLKEQFSRHDLLLLGIGLGLWWGEGSKKHRNAIRLGNSDPALIAKFIEFLCSICGVPKDKLRFGLQVFSDMDPLKVKEYWVKAIGVSDEQFFPKIIVTQSGSIGSYREKTKHGVLTVYCSNTKLRSVIDDLMEEYVS